MRLSFFKKNRQIDCYNIFNVTCVFEKYWYVLEMFLNYSWIFISKIADQAGFNMIFYSSKKQTVVLVYFVFNIVDVTYNDPVVAFIT